MKKIIVDGNKCIGCGLCESLCPEIFELKNGKSIAKEGNIEKNKECIEEAISSCPTQAISIESEK